MGTTEEAPETEGEPEALGDPPPLELARVILDPETGAWELDDMPLADGSTFHGDDGYLGLGCYPDVVGFGLGIRSSDLVLPEDLLDWADPRMPLLATELTELNEDGELGESLWSLANYPMAMKPLDDGVLEGYTVLFPTILEAERIDGRPARLSVTLDTYLNEPAHLELDVLLEFSEMDDDAPPASQEER